MTINDITHPEYEKAKRAKAAAVLCDIQLAMIDRELRRLAENPLEALGIEVES